MTRWTADSIPDQTGRVALVTGANSGLGWHTSFQLARAGARVLLGCRDLGKGSAAVSLIRDRLPAARVELLPLDLADLTTVASAVEDLTQRVDRLDLLVNNAGVMALPYRQTADGFEMQFGTNHLGHFALTGRVLPLLLAASAPRVVTVSSMAHKGGKIHFDDLQWEQGYRKWGAYCQSKLANLLFTFELDRRSRAAGVPIISAAAHPGYASTELQTAGPKMAGSGLKAAVMTLGNAIVGQSAADGALPSLYAATMPDVRGSDYYGPAIFGWRGWPTKASPTKAAQDPETARRLWDVSEELTKVSYELTPAR